MAVLCVVASCAATTHRKMPWPKDDGSLPLDNAPERRIDRATEPQIVTIESSISSPKAIAHGAMGGPLTSVYNIPEYSLKSREVYFAWPLPATGITSLFGMRSDPIDGEQRFHSGVDLQSRYGTAVEAAADGVVVEAGWKGSHGRSVTIQHKHNFRTTYSHLAQILVVPGTDVSSGQAVGLVGNSGRSTGPHLHFELLRDNEYLDPLDYLGISILVED